MIFALLCCALLQNPNPAGGWNEPIWTRGFPNAVHPAILEGGDLTGDGIPEIILTSNEEHWTFEVLDGADGSTWFQYNQPDIDVHSYIFSWRDLDGDGVQELIFRNPLSLGYRGLILVIHGGDGIPMWDAQGREDYDRLGKDLIFQDLDGDGLSDLIVGSTTKGKISALDGRTGVEIWRLKNRGRKFYSATPDLNGDGILDIVIGGRGHVNAISGADGLIIWAKATLELNSAIDWSVNFIDSNQDGVQDIIISNASQDYAGDVHAGVVEAFDGQSGDWLWTTVGDAENNLGGKMVSQDFNSDGVKDLLSVHPTAPTLLDGKNGNKIWQRNFSNPFHSVSPPLIHDLNGDQIADILITYPSSGSTQPDNLELLDGLDGSTIWTVHRTQEDENFLQLTLVDLDQDGIDDIFAASPLAGIAGNQAGMVRAINGTTGADFWTVLGSGAGEKLGEVFSLVEIDSVPGPDVILSSTWSDQARSRFAANGASGNLIWHQTYEADAFPLQSWNSVDLNGDQVSDILEFQFDYSQFIRPYRTHYQAIDSQTGETIWHKDFLTDTRDPVTFHQKIPDIDGDGVEELTYFIPDFLISYAYTLRTYSGADMGYTTGLNLSAGHISANGGGQIYIDISFPPEQAGWGYQLLLSENGNGPIDLNGLAIPLSFGYWFTSSFIGDYPLNIFNSPIGVLDSQSSARIEIEALPGIIPSSSVGLSMSIAVVSHPQAGAWEFSSGGASIEITP